MPQKIKNIDTQWLLEQFKDVRVVGFVVFGVLVLFVSYSGVKVIQTNYDLQKQMAKLEQQNQVGELENANMKFKNQYYNTDQYLELAARKQYNKGLEGESLLLVPKNVALAHTVAMPEQDNKPIDPKRQSKAQQNIEAWREFFLHKNMAK